MPKQSRLSFATRQSVDLTIKLSLCTLALLVSGCSTIPKSRVEDRFSTPEARAYCGQVLVRKDGRYTLGEAPIEEQQVLELFDMTGNQDLRPLFHDDIMFRSIFGTMLGLSTLTIGAGLVNVSFSGPWAPLLGLGALAGGGGLAYISRNPKDGLVSNYNHRMLESCAGTPRKPFSTPESRAYCGYFLEQKGGNYTVRYTTEEEQLPGLYETGGRRTVREEPYDEAQVLRLFELTGNNDIRRLFQNNDRKRTWAGAVGGLSLLPLGALLATGGTENGFIQVAVGATTIFGLVSVVNAFRNSKDGLIAEYNQRVRKLCPSD